MHIAQTDNSLKKWGVPVLKKYCSFIIVIMMVKNWILLEFRYLRSYIFYAHVLCSCARETITATMWFMEVVPRKSANILDVGVVIVCPNHSILISESKQG